VDRAPESQRVRDITRRFLVVYNRWPIESFDDVQAARRRRQELIDNQNNSLHDSFPNHAWDVSPLWQVRDVLGLVQTRRSFWARLRHLFGGDTDEI
jgi:hypothetical protein